MYRYIFLSTVVVQLSLMNQPLFQGAKSLLSFVTVVTPLPTVAFQNQSKRFTSVFSTTRVLIGSRLKKKNIVSGMSMAMHDMKAGVKLDSPSAERNKEPIWKVLETKVISELVQNPCVPVILEIAAGAGVHTQFFSKQLLQKHRDKPFQWYPADADESCLHSIIAHVEGDSELYTSNVVKAPAKMTMIQSGILEEETINLYSNVSFDLMLNINMIHISPWEATRGLLKFAGEKLKKTTGFLFLYGPYKVGGTYSESNRYVFTDIWGHRFHFPH
jgi:Protein of unknown function (DUF938)